MLKLIRSAAVALMLIPTTSSAEDFGVGMAAYRAGDFATALSEWTPLAEQGSADAQFFLGTMHDKGEGVPPDAAEAVKWWRLAAEQGDSSAQFMVGSRYANGTGVPQDYAEAVKWLK
jgi:TPR repeat protein